MIDYLIIGSGVVGSFLAQTLASKGSVAVIEKEKDVALIQTTHNSALVHSPVLITPKKGILKAQLALEGNAFYQAHAESLGIPVNKNGALLVAKTQAEMDEAIAIAEAAKARGIHDVEILSGPAMMMLEPHLNEDVVGGLSLPTAMTADTYQLCQKLKSMAESDGAEFYFNETVKEIKYVDNHFEVITDHDIYHAVHVLNAAGVYAEKVAAMIEKEVPYQMRPQRGEYLVLGPEANAFVTRTLFPMPSKVSKGILVIPQPDGTIRLGPTSAYQDSLDDDTLSEKGLQEVKDGVDGLLTNIPYQHVIKKYVGIRSSTTHKDFYIQRSKEYENFIHVAGIDSPGVTAAPAIARYVAREILGL
jgi:glycerol-3-phosphate dehydrogenase